MTTERSKISASKKARAILLIYTMLGVVAIGVCFIVDFATSAGITWSLYVLYAVPVLFLGMIPLCLKVKHNLALSAAVLSIMAFPFLYLIDNITEKSDWFAPLALPIAITAIAGAWISGIMLKFTPTKNKWVLSGILLFVYGTVMILTVVTTVGNYTGNTPSQLISIIGIFSFAVAGAILGSVGFFRGMIKSKTSE